MIESGGSGSSSSNSSNDKYANLYLLQQSNCSPSENSITIEPEVTIPHLQEVHIEQTNTFNGDSNESLET